MSSVHTLPVALSSGLTAALAPEVRFGQTPQQGWQPLAQLSRFDLAPVMTRRPLQLLGPPVLPRTSLSGLSSVQGRIGVWLQDSPAVLQLLRLAFAASFKPVTTIPDGLPLPDTTATLDWHQLRFAQQHSSAALITAYDPAGQADLFTGLRVSALQLILAPATPPLADFTLMGRQHLVIDAGARPSLSTPPPLPTAVPEARLMVTVAGQPVPYPVQMRIDLSRTPARPHYSLGQTRPDRISLGLPRVTASLSFWLSDRQSLSWTEASSLARLGLTLRLSPSSWLALSVPSARVLASRHRHSGASEAVLSQVDLECGTGLSVLFARLARV